MYGQVTAGTTGLGAGTSLAMTGFGVLSWIVAALSLVVLGVALLKAFRRVPGDDA